MIFKKKIIGILSDFVEKDQIDTQSRSYYRVRANYFEALKSAMENLKVTNIAIVIIPCDVNEIDFYIELCDGIVALGGSDIPPRLYKEDIRYQTVKVNEKRFSFEIPFINAYLKTEKPMFGICAGMQAMNVAAGGSLYQDMIGDAMSSIIHSQKGCWKSASHVIHIDKNSKLANISKERSTFVNSVHHQAIKDLANLFTASAVSSDDIIEAIEIPDRSFCLGVQWHPEFFSSKVDILLWESFIKSVA